MQRRSADSKVVGTVHASLLSCVGTVLPVVHHLGYEAERRDLPPAERAALASAVEKLRADSQLGFPHTIPVRGGEFGIRELRPGRDARDGVRCTGGLRT
jgi:hypothetical protein